MLKSNSNIRFEAFNILGEKAIEVIANYNLLPGMNYCESDGRNTSVKEMSSGIYFYELKRLKNRKNDLLDTFVKLRQNLFF